MHPVSVRVPGSTSNCGAGFDTLGLALQVYNTVTLTPRGDAQIAGERESDERATDLVAQAVDAFGAAAGNFRPGFDYRIEGDVPPARGLGSSVTILAGVLGGLNRWAGEPLDRAELAAILTRIEGHPDNATAGVWGGFCVARCHPTPADYCDTVRVEVPAEIRFVVVSPAVEISTKISRGTLPAQISHLDAVRSVNSAAYLTAAFATGNWAKLRGAVGDFLHEPYRLPGIPGGAEAIAAGIAAGAFTGWLSGSGSSVLCVVRADMADFVGAAMRDAFSAVDTPSAVRVLAADNAGYVVQALA